MGDSTAMQVLVYDCPLDQRQAAGEILAGMRSETAQNETGYTVVDNTRNAEGKRIRRGDEALTLRTFTSQEDAEAYAATLPGAGDDRYSIDEVELVNIGEEYLNPDISCGSADEYGTWLIDAAPGCSFILWEDPAYQWLGSLWAYAPDLGSFTAECDADGTVTLSPDEIRGVIRKSRDAVQAALDPFMSLDGDQERADAAIATVLGEIDRACGKPWFDRQREHERA